MSVARECEPGEFAGLVDLTMLARELAVSWRLAYCESDDTWELEISSAARDDCAEFDKGAGPAGVIEKGVAHLRFRRILVTGTGA